jgi:hypothetical protein
MADSTSSARQEAERLVATVLAMAAQSGLGGAGRGRDEGVPGTSALNALGNTVAGMVGQLTGTSGGHRSAGGSAKEGWATGSAECCVCPICKAIAAMRDPSPQTAARLASGAGDFATGVASLMRAFSALSGDRSRTSRPARPAPPPPDPDTAWSAATHSPGDHEPAPEPAPDQNASPWSAATRAPAPEGPAPEGQAEEPVPGGQAEEPAPGGQAEEPAPASERPEPYAAPWSAGSPAPAPGRNASPWESATRAPDKPGGADPGRSAAAPGPRIKEGFGSSSTARRTGSRDVWAAATDPEVPGVAVPPAEDHDDAGDGEHR